MTDFFPRSQKLISGERNKTAIGCETPWPRCATRIMQKKKNDRFFIFSDDFGFRENRHSENHFISAKKLVPGVMPQHTSIVARVFLAPCFVFLLRFVSFTNHERASTQPNPNPNPNRNSGSGGLRFGFERRSRRGVSDKKKTEEKVRTPTKIELFFVLLSGMICGWRTSQRLYGSPRPDLTREK